MGVGFRSGLRSLAAWFGLAFVLLMGLATLVGSGGGGGNEALPPPTFTVQPVSQSAPEGTSVTFAVSTSGTEVTLRWQRSTDAGASWADITGATSSSYMIAAISTAMNGHQFRAVASNAGGSVQSSAATLSVTPLTPPVIVVQPGDQTVIALTNATFSVTASGTSLAYQWQASTDGTSWSNIVGANAATLSLTAAPLVDNGKRYRVIVSNNAGSVTSSAALLSVNPPPVAPVITLQPASASVLSGQTATFSITATGTPPPAYRWQSAPASTPNTFSDIAGAASASHTTAAAVSGDNGMRFRVIVSNVAGSVTSDIATLTVTPVSPPVVTLNPVDRFAYLPNGDFVGSTATFTAAFSGTPTPTLQWQVSTDGGATFSNINGATAASFTTATVGAGDDARRFRLVAANVGGGATTNAALLSVRNAGVGGESFGLAVRPNGEVVAAVGHFERCFTCPNMTLPSFYGIRTISPTGQVRTLAGGNAQGATDGTGPAASFLRPMGLALDAAGNAYVTDRHTIRKITPAGAVITLAGVWNQPGFINDTGALARFNDLSGITIDSAGNLYVTDTRNFAIRKITPAGVVSTVAGNGNLQWVDGTGSAASFVWPLGIGFGPGGDLFVTDAFQQGVTAVCLIRRVTLAGVVTTVNGPTCGSLNGALAGAQFSLAWGVASDAAGNLFIAEPGAVRVISAAGVVSTLPGSIVPTGAFVNRSHVGIAVDAAGSVFVHSDHRNNTVDNLILKIAPGGATTLVP